MTVNKVSITRKDLARGIDSFSAKGSIPEGFAEDLQNVDTNANGRLATRPGYEGVYGWMPLRIREVRHVGTKIRFYLDEATTIDLDRATTGPLIARGRLSGATTNQPLPSNDFAVGSDSVHYYPYFLITSRDFLDGDGAVHTISKLASDHGISHRNYWVGLAKALGQASQTNQALIPDAVRVDTATFDAEIDYQVNLDSEAFVYFRETEAIPGQIYYTDETAQTVVSVPVGTHALDTFNIIVKCYDTVVVPGSQTEVLPQDITIDGAGTVEITFASAFTGRIYLEAVPPEQSSSGSASVGTNTITIPSPGGPFLFFAVYRYNPSTLENEAVIVDDWVYDEDTDAVTITYVLASAAESVDIYWTTGQIISNVIEVEDTGLVSTNYIDGAPQMTLWGLDHDGIYRDPTARGGHVNHIDSYRRIGESRLICGLGGNLFSATSYEEAAAAVLMGTLGVDLRERLDGDVGLAPLFHKVDPGAVRTRGVIYDAWVSTDHYARCTGAAFVSLGVVDYTLEFTAKSGTLTLGTQVDGADQLTVADLPFPEHTGAWTIISVTDAGNSVTIRASNPNIKSAKFNTAGARGRAGVFTDRLTLELAAAFIPGDRILTAIPTGLTCTVVAISGLDVTLDGVTEDFPIADGTLMFAERVTDLVPTRDLASGAASAADVIRGDMLRVSGLARRTRAIYLNTQAPQAVSFLGDGSTVTATTIAEHRLTAGQKILLREATGGGASGYVTVGVVPTPTTFTFPGTAVGGAAVIVGPTVQVDEPLTLRDSGSAPSTLTVDGRWIPVEAPEHDFDMPDNTYRAHFRTFGYDQQPVLRSTMVSDNLYFANQADEVMKFDGTSIYRAGLPRWHPSLFATNDTTATPALNLGPEIAYTGLNTSGLFFIIDSPILTKGDRVAASTGAIWLVVADPAATDVGGVTKYKIQLAPDSDFTGSPVTPIRKVQYYKYMLRLSLVDANDNIIVSTEVQSRDLQMEYVSSGQIKLKLLGMPDFGIYDYSRIQAEIFRTVAGGSQRFRIHRQNLDFDNFSGYFIISDATQDTELTEARVDEVAIGTNIERGVGIGTAWEQPPRAKHISSANGRLLLANLAGYPEVTVSLQPASGTTNLTAANLIGKVLLFRRDSSDTDLTADTVDRLGLAYVNSGATTITTPASDITIGSDSVSGYFTVATATPPAVGSWVYLFHAAAGTNKSLTFSGWFQVSSQPTGTSFRVRANGLSAPTANDVNRFVVGASGQVPVWLGVDGNYGQEDLGEPGADIRHIAAIRTSNAINATMRAADRQLSGQEDFSPWLSAVAGADYPSGTIIVSQPLAQPVAPGLRLPSSMTGVQFFVNGLLRVADTELEFIIRRLGSYLARSYRNYPELFDNPLVPDTGSSDSVIPINPADGQEITAMIPFFGVSTAGAASQLEQSVVVFKTNSIYLVDVETRTVTRVDSRGLGCTAPRSVASSRNGIVFANESGVFMLTRNLEVVPVGQALTSVWRDTINRDQLAEATGHHYGTGRRYKLSVPVGSDLYCSSVMVYDYEREGETFGAWTRHTNHPATGWCNLGKDAYFASQAGDVFLVRNRGEASDFRDEDQAVAEALIVLRAEDFDLPGVRKLVTRIISLFELELSDLTDVAIATATDLSTDFAQVGAPAVTRAAYRQITLASTPAARRGTQIQVRYVHQQKDEQLVLTAVVYTVGQLNETLIKQTKQFEGS